MYFLRLNSIKHGDIPAIAMLVYQRVYQTNFSSQKKSDKKSHPNKRQPTINHPVGWDLVVRFTGPILVVQVFFGWLIFGDVPFPMIGIDAPNIHTHNISTAGKPTSKVLPTSD